LLTFLKNQYNVLCGNGTIEAKTEVDKRILFNNANINNNLPKLSQNFPNVKKDLSNKDEEHLEIHLEEKKKKLA